MAFKNKAQTQQTQSTQAQPVTDGAAALRAELAAMQAKYAAAERFALEQKARAEQAELAAKLAASKPVREKVPAGTPALSDTGWATVSGIGGTLSPALVLALVESAQGVDGAAFPDLAESLVRMIAGAEVLAHEGAKVEKLDANGQPTKDAAKVASKKLVNVDPAKVADLKLRAARLLGA